MAILDVLLLWESLVLVLKVLIRRWEDSRVCGLELSVRYIPSLAVDPSVQASTLNQDLSMGYAVVAVGPGNIDQLP